MAALPKDGNRRGGSFPIFAPVTRDGKKGYMANPLEIAKNRVAQFEDAVDPLMIDHQAAMNCFDCEAFLQTGIDAIRWLVLAEQAVMNQHKLGVTLIPKEFYPWLEGCYNNFVRRSAFAKKWISECDSRGDEVANAEEFDRCVESAEDWLEQRAWRNQSASVFAED